MHINITTKRKVGAVLPLILLAIYLVYSCVPEQDLTQPTESLKLSPTFILYNRIPKCGSSFFKVLVASLALKNGFTKVDSIKNFRLKTLLHWLQKWSWFFSQTC